MKEILISRCAECASYLHVGINLRFVDAPLSKQNVRLPGGLRREDNRAGHRAQADHKSIPQIHPLAGYTAAQGARHEAERILPDRVRVRARVPNHSGTGDTAAGEKSQSP